MALVRETMNHVIVIDGILREVKRINPNGTLEVKRPGKTALDNVKFKTGMVIETTRNYKGKFTSHRVQVG